MNPQIDALVLAAGQSSRMGEHHKILLPTENGHNVLSQLLATLLKSLDGRIVVVLGRGASHVKQNILDKNLNDSKRIEFLTNLDFHNGMSTSLALGIAEFTNTHNGLAVFLADQPLITKADINALVASYKNKATDCLAVAAAKGNKRLNPVIFTPACLKELRESSSDTGPNDTGAKGLLQKHKEQVALVDLGNGVWSRDIDDWEEYVGLARALNWQDALKFIDAHQS